MTSAEASALAGASFGAGTEEDTNGGKRCTYGAQTMNVFTVQVAQATDAATAQADWAQEEAQADAAMTKSLPGGISAAPQLADVSGIGDKAATATWSASVSGQTINLSAIYLLKGATFLSFADLVLNKPAPTVAALEAQATTSLSRIP